MKRGFNLGGRIIIFVLILFEKTPKNYFFGVGGGAGRISFSNFFLI